MTPNQIARKPDIRTVFYKSRIEDIIASQYAIGGINIL